MDQNQLIKNASYASVSISILIFIIKVFGWIESDSISLFASLVDSSLDMVSSLFNMIAVSIALAPPDENHRFGHNKVQDLAIFGQSVFFISSGAFSLFVSIKRLIKGHHIVNYDTGLFSMLICLFLGLGLLLYQTYVIRKTNSEIIKADKIHYVSDTATNISVIVSIATSKYFYAIDSIFAILISFYIIYSAIKLLRMSVKNLIDEEFSPDDKEKVLSILKNDTDILGVHDLKTRHAGDKAFIQFHIDLDPSLSLIAAHKISENIIDKIRMAFPNCEVIIHQDPLGYDEEVQYRENI
jgi:ferrous-iron efflux pump FieF